MIGQMYKPKAYHRFEDDDFILMESLENVVALMNARTNDIHWITKHVLKTEYVQKGGSE